MVIFDLICENGHQFEGWFTSLADLEAQTAAKLLTCPYCGAEDVERCPSTFGLVKSRPAEPAPPPQSAEPDSPAARLLEAYERLKEMTKTLERDFKDVGQDFSAEALKMHYGASPARNIRGHSTADEEESLRSEGVEFFKLPVLSRKDPVS
jgi:hypothetical protein